METINLWLSDDEDRISDLPDNLIHNILSFVDIKHGIEASVLSRRWRYLWKSLPTLNIDDGLHSWYTEKENEHTTLNINGFVDFVDNVLRLRESSDIRRFNLACEIFDEDRMDCHIHRWILAAVRHNVQELCFSRSIFAHTFEIPHCLFSCKSLVKLKLKISMVNNDEYKVVLPSSMSLPQLKYLKIRSLPFDDERLTNMFFSSCPVLESLILKRCEFHNLNLSISSPTLKHFKFCSCCDEDYDTKVKLNAPNLTSICFNSHLSKGHSLENLSSLVTADINFFIERRDLVPGTYELVTEKKELYAQPTLKFLIALHNVKVLKLSSWILQVVSRAPEILHNQPIQFFNLQSLKLGTFLSRDCMDSIIYLLNISPNIESISLQILKKKLNSGNTEVDYWEAGLSLSPCMLCHLKIVKIRELLGCINELKFLEILLKNALVLEKVVLFSSTRWQEQDRCDRERRMIKFRDMLFSFPRASASTEILFRF